MGVDGFFLISGFLITKSIQQSSSITSYLVKRVARIYPGFIIASLITIFCVAPMSGANLASLSTMEWTKNLARIFMLQPPWIEGTFPGQPTGLLNGSMWTIAYEFRCYLLLIALSASRLLSRRWLVLIGTVCFWIVVVGFLGDRERNNYEFAFGIAHDSGRLTAIFLTGVVYYLFRSLIDFSNGFIALSCGIALVVALHFPITADIAIAVFGGYLIFWFAFWPNSKALNQINNRVDLSYGCYLYAWPIQMLCVKYFTGTSALGLILVATVASMVLGFLSWKLVEHPSLKASQRFTRTAIPKKQCSDEQRAA